MYWLILILYVHLKHKLYNTEIYVKNYYIWPLITNYYPF